MELVSIIYSSLLFVFSLLGIVLIFSFTYSKLFAKENSKVRVSKNREYEKQKNNYKRSSVKPASGIKSISAHKESVVNNRERKPVVNKEIKSVHRVERALIEEKKIRVVSNSSRGRTRREYMRSANVNSVSRYSVVNNFARERSTDNDLYAKFSKMSVEYSQIA